jgi:predicted glycoside hydrolase/deacetylase ChbG (UPF0249 family)
MTAARRRLIVNADDLGANEARDRGILEAFRAGIVTSASLLANGASAGAGAAAACAEPRLAATLGLHLNLSEGRPLGLGHRTLVGPDGCFHGKGETRRRLLEGEIDPEEIQVEVARQFAFFGAKLGRISGFAHLDGHQHVHVFGPVPEIAAQCAAALGFRFARVPAGPGLSELRHLAERAAAIFTRHGMRAVAHFRGAEALWNPSEAGLLEILGTLEAGTTELMVHPGYAAPKEKGPFGAFSTEAREVELRALTSRAARERVEREGIELISFADL